MSKSKLRIPAIQLKQSGTNLYVFSMPAKKLWDICEINEKTENKDDGYQRALSNSRATDIKRYILKGNAIAPAIIISFNDKKATFDPESKELIIDDTSDAGWVIDGQHRLRGADLASAEDINIELAVVAFLDLKIEEQIQQFVTINREAKGVPTSLYYDLLKQLPVKSSTDVAKEKAAAIADVLRKDPESPFYERIVIVTSPKKGEISLNNFVRKVYPLVADEKGLFSSYSQKEVTIIIDNFFRALKSVYPNEFSHNKQRFFQTLGFGAMLNSLYPTFSLVLKQEQAFRIPDIEKVLSKISDFSFSDWDRIGSGTQAEKQAGRDFETTLKAAWSDEKSQEGSLRLF
ncbi:DGQHR domain-containing protein [Halomonas sp. NyZ770]|uniref:DGQHR domain-containing protein n=1 Tax=Halomonas sp. NyZ770 TaxID=2883106 RepID=UPI001D0B0AFD|nr:DGQHR domain-containing protein [Halomonas sp. NyZ770]UDM06287.1 DGQHR domain-containing protein [Halomonas sp. NyZ770]